MNTTAQRLFCKITEEMPSRYQEESFKAMMGLLLEGQGRAKAEHCKVKSPAALSRFMNDYIWSTRRLIREVRHTLLNEVEKFYQRQRGRKPILYVLIDLTSIEKAGVFEALPCGSLNDVTGLHVVVLYVLIGKYRLPWSFRIWRGAGQRSPAELALKLLSGLPAFFKQSFVIRVLADGGFSSAVFLNGVVNLGLEALVAIRCDRRLDQGGYLDETKQGEYVKLKGLELPLWTAHFTLPRHEKDPEVRYGVATFQATARHLIKVGKKRFKIEGFFKTIKHTFSLHRFGQRTRMGAYRFLVLSFFAFILSHLQHLAHYHPHLPQWSRLAQHLRRVLLPDLVWLELLLEQQQLRLALSG
jgi:Transposase DDE domain